MADENPIVSLDVPEEANSEELEELLQQTLGTEAVQEEISDTTEPEPEEPEQTDPSAELEKLKLENEKYKKQLKDKDDFINRRNAEVGLLRKQLKERKEALMNEDLSDEEIMENPKEAIKKALERKEQIKALEEEEQKLDIEDIRARNREIIDRLVPNFEDVTPNIAEVLASDGAPPEMIERFSSDPALTIPPAVIFQLSKRAELQARIAELEAKLAQSKDAPKKIIDNIQKFSQSKSPVASAPTTARKSPVKLANLTEADIDKMSLEELQELEKELK